MVSKEQRDAARIIADSIYDLEKLADRDNGRGWFLYSMFDTIAKGEAKSIDSQFIVKLALEEIMGGNNRSGMNVSREALVALGSSFAVEQGKSSSMSK